MLARRERLIDVRDDDGTAGALLARALQAQPTVAPVPLEVRARPPTAVAARFFNLGQENYRAVFFKSLPRNPAITVGHPTPRDNLSDAVLSSDEYVNLHFPYSQPSITTASVDDVANPPILTLGGVSFGKQSGRAIFNDSDLKVLTWSDDKVTVALPAVAQSGKLILKQDPAESNAVNLTVVEGYREPPRLSIVNNTSFPIVLRIVPSDVGTNVELEIPPGGSQVTRVLPGSYRVVASARGTLTVADDATETRVFERGGQYSLTYMSNSFAVRDLTVNNQTGSPITITFSVGRTMSVPAGTITVQVPAGNYSISVSSRCGSRTDSVTPQTASVTYQCSR